jgi:hypothetical protein
MQQRAHQGHAVIGCYKDIASRHNQQQADQ